MKDIDFNNDTLTIRKTKSKEYRLVPMDPSLADILAKYCKAFGLGADPEAYIFPGTDFSKPMEGVKPSRERAEHSSMRSAPPSTALITL